MSDDNNQAPAFDAAPQRNGGGINGKLKAQPQNYKRLNPKVKNLIIFGSAAILALIILAILNINPPPPAAAKKKDTAAPGTSMQGTTPESVTSAPNGVPSAGGAAVADSPSALSGVGGASAPASASAIAGAGRDDLSVAGRAGNVPGISGTGAYPEHAGAAREKTPAELLAEQAETSRREALQRGADSSLEGQGQDSSGGLPTALKTGLPLVGALGGGGGVGSIGGGGQTTAMVPLAEDPNRQVHKEQFLKNASIAQLDDVLLQPVHKSLSPYTVNAGWLIPSIMVSGMKSDLPGQLRAQVRENVKDTVTGEYTLIPRGSTLIGTYDSQVAFGQSRVLVVWSRVIFPDGSSLNLQGMPGADEQGFAGLTGDVDNHMWPIIKAAVFMSVISAGAQLSQPQSSNANGTYAAPSAGQQLAAALGQQLGQAGSQLFSRYLNIQPTITTDPGTRFNILVTKDIVFPQPWTWN